MSGRRRTPQDLILVGFTAGVFLLVVLGMAVGVLAGRGPIKGSCGGISAMSGEDCPICGGNPARCEGQESPREGVAYDATTCFENAQRSGAVLPYAGYPAVVYDGNAARRCLSAFKAHTASCDYYEEIKPRPAVRKSSRAPSR